MKWEYYNVTVSKECQTLEEIQHVLQMKTEFKFLPLDTLIKYVFIFYRHVEQLKIFFSQTNCQKPCKYKKYVKTSVLDKLQDTSGLPGYMFGFSTNTVTVKQEAYLYPLSSLVAEFGGTLGLFVGFSFLTLWEILLWLIKLFASLKLN